MKNYSYRINLFLLQIGSEDGLSVTADMENHYSTSNHFSSNSSHVMGGSNNGHHLQNHNNQGSGGGSSNNSDNRIVFLEKELSHWRAQYELLKIESSSHRGVHGGGENATRKNDEFSLDVGEK